MHFDVAIVIVTYNSEEQIETCLESLFAQAKHVRQQVIVVDNLSKDGTVEIIRDKFPAVELILPGANLGFAKGVNLGARHARADYVLLLNPDTEVLEHAVDEAVTFARQHPHYAIYGGRNFKPDLTLEPSSCWGQPTLWSMAMFALGFSTLFRHHPWFDPESLGGWKRDTVREVGVITGCFLLAKKEAWDRLGGMDERFFMYGEDVDFAMRARALGFKPVIIPTAKTIHEVGASSDKPTHKMMLLYKGKAALVRTHWHGLGQKAGLFFLLLGVAVRAFPAWLKSLVSSDVTPERWWHLWQKRREWIQGYPVQKTS